MNIQEKKSTMRTSQAALSSEVVIKRCRQSRKIPIGAKK